MYNFILCEIKSGEDSPIIWAEIEIDLILKIVQISFSVM